MSDLNSAIQQGGALVIGALNSANAAQASKDNIAAVQEMNRGNMELAKYQFEQNLEMWNKQNAYNTPLAQMQRFKDAGLNPNLIFGQGSNGNASSAPEYKAPNLQAYTGRTRDAQMLAQTSMLALDMQQKQLQNQNLEAQNANIEAQTANTIAQTQGTYASTANTMAQTEYFISTMPWREREQIAKTLGLEADASVQQLATAVAMSEDYGLIQQTKENLRLITNNADIAWENWKIANANGTLLQAQAKYADELASLGVKDAQAKIKFTTQSIINLVKEGKLKDLQAAIDSYFADMAKNGVNPKLDPTLMMTLDLIKGLVGVNGSPFQVGTAIRQGISNILPSVGNMMIQPFKLGWNLVGGTYNFFKNAVTPNLKSH